MIMEMVVAGVLATLFMDLWQRLLAVTVAVPPPNWALVGRWFVEAGRGRLFHDPIAAAPEAKHELAIGWIGHYATGIAYGVVYVVVVRMLFGLDAGSLFVGLVFGALSVVVPWFFFMPAMGNGVLGAKTPNPAKACLLAFLAHSVFGLGLAAGAFIVGA